MCYEGDSLVNLERAAVQTKNPAKCAEPPICIAAVLYLLGPERSRIGGMIDNIRKIAYNQAKFVLQM